MYCDFGNWHTAVLPFLINPFMWLDWLPTCYRHKTWCKKLMVKSKRQNWLIKIEQQKNFSGVGWGGGGVKQQSYVRQDVKKKHCYNKRSSYHAISLLVLRNSYFIDTTHYITLLLFNVTLSLVVIVTLLDGLLCSAKTLAFILFSLVFVLSRRLFSQHRQSVINKRSSELHVANRLQLQKWAPAPTKTVDNLVRQNQLFKKAGPFQWNKIICHTTKS